jgi:hypothetical protein
MTWKITAILAILVVSGVGMAQAEQATVKVPFDSHGQSCWYDKAVIEYHCTWQGYPEQFTVEDLEQFKDVLSEEVYEEELAKLVAKTETVTIPKLTADEKTIQKLESRLIDGTMTTPDAVLLQMLRTLDECQQGLGNSSAIQTERTFVISEYQHLDVSNVQIEGQLGELSLAIEECKAQQVLEHQILTVAYLHFKEADRAGNFDHMGILEGVSAIPYDHFTSTDRSVDTSVICNNNQYTQDNKELMGCPPIVYESNNPYSEGNGFISYYSPIIEEYTFFMQDYGNKIATSHDKLVQEGIAKPIVKKMIEDNHFVQNQLRNEE